MKDPIAEAIELTDAEFAQRDGALHVDMPDEPLMALADPFQVKRLVLNLLRNAAQAGESVWVTGSQRNGEVKIVVKDDGPGVPAELRDRIFDPFVSDKEQGAGLGLAIVKGIADANEARVLLVDEEQSAGEGAEFHVYFKSPEDLPVDGALLATPASAASEAVG